MKIDKIYVITLDSQDVAMQKKTSANLQRLNFAGKTGYELHPAWNGNENGTPEGYSAYKGWNLKDSWNAWWKRDILPGEIGCMSSHIHVWERIVAEGLERTLIFEDDFDPSQANIGLLDEPSTSFDIAYLGRWKINKEAKEESIGGSWVKPVASYCTHAYVVTLEGAKKLLEYNIKENLIPADEFMTATFTEHRRPDIAKLFPPKLNVIATAKQNYIPQKRKQEDSTIELNPNQNPNLMKNNKENKNKIDEPQPYFEILDTADWDAWKAKYVDNGMLRGEFDLMVDDVGDNVFEFPLFTEKFCREAVALSEALNKWTIDRHEFYPTNDVLLQDIGLQSAYHQVLKEVVYPLCIHLWTLEGKGWKDMFSENFLARYTTDRQSHLSLHHDFSHITMVVKLNDEFDGGGTWFPKYNLLSNPERVGTATLHPGMVTHLHGARPIHAGKRYICVSFMRKQ